MVVRGAFLFLFNSPVNEKPVSVIHLVQCELILPPNDGKNFESRNASVAKKITKSTAPPEAGYEFKLILSSGLTPALRLYSHSEEERTHWVTALQAHIDQANADDCVELLQGTKSYYHPLTPLSPHATGNTPEQSLVSDSHANIVITAIKLAPLMKKKSQIQQQQQSFTQQQAFVHQESFIAQQQQQQQQQQSFIQQSNIPPPPMSQQQEQEQQGGYDDEANEKEEAQSQVGNDATSVTSKTSKARSEVSKGNTVATPPNLPVAQTQVRQSCLAGSTVVPVQHIMGFDQGMPVYINNVTAIVTDASNGELRLDRPLLVNIEEKSFVFGFAVGTVSQLDSTESATIQEPTTASANDTTNQSRGSGGDPKKMGLMSRLSMITPEEKEEVQVEEEKSGVKSSTEAVQSQEKEETIDESNPYLENKDSGAEDDATNKRKSLSLNQLPVPGGEGDEEEELMDQFDRLNSALDVGDHSHRKTKSNLEYFDDDDMQTENTAALTGADIQDLFEKGTVQRKLFERSIKRRQFRELEGRRREQLCFDDLADVEQTVEAQQRERQDPLFLAELLRTLLYFKGYSMVEDASGDNLLDFVDYEIPMLNGEWAETAMVTVYKFYTNDSGFMSLEELIRFFTDSGIVNTHCPHTEFDEPVMEIAEQLDPLRMIVTLPPVGILGINNPDENIASAALQEALKNDPYTINFAQFFSILLRISQVVYPDLHEENKKGALNKVLTESVLPLYGWCLGHDKRGCEDPLVSDERIALLLMTYAPNLWKVFLAYSQDSSHRPPNIDEMTFPNYAQACERAFFGAPKGAPYKAPMLEEEDDSSDVFSTSVGSLSKSRDRTKQQQDFLRKGKDSPSVKSVVKGSIAAKKALHKRYSMSASMSRDPNERYEDGEKVAFVENNASLKTAAEKKQSSRTKSQVLEESAAKYGFFMSENKVMQFCTDYGLANHLVSRQTIKQLFYRLNRKKNVTVGLKETKVDSKIASVAKGKESMTLAQKLKSRRQSVVNTLDQKYMTHQRAEASDDTFHMRKGHKFRQGQAVPSGSLKTKPVVSQASAINLTGGLSFSEFMEFLCHLALAGMR
jgi:hypothetical protein